jgi:hypothetical protein
MAKPEEKRLLPALGPTINPESHAHVAFYHDTVVFVKHPTHVGYCQEFP